MRITICARILYYIDIIYTRLRSSSCNYTHSGHPEVFRVQIICRHTRDCESRVPTALWKIKSAPAREHRLIIIQIRWLQSSGGRTVNMVGTIVVDAVVSPAAAAADRKFQSYYILCILGITTRVIIVLLRVYVLKTISLFMLIFLPYACRALKSAAYNIIL